MPVLHEMIQYHWFYELSALVLALGVFYSWYRCRIVRTADVGRTLVFVISSLALGVCATKTGEALARRFSREGVLPRSPPFEEETVAAGLFSCISITPPGTNGVASVAVSWVPSAVPVGSHIELHYRTNLVGAVWTPVDEHVVRSDEANHVFAVSLPAPVPSAGFWKAHADVVTLDIPEAVSLVQSDGRRLLVTVEPTVNVVLGPRDRPDDTPPYDPDYAENPFVHAEGLAYDATNGTLTVSAPGQYDLPDGSVLLSLDPSVSFGDGHDYTGDAIALVQDDHGNALGWIQSDAYPLDSEALWRGWHDGRNAVGDFACSCVPVVDLGVDPSDHPRVTTSYTVDGVTATGWVYCDSVPVWSNACTHVRRSRFGGASDSLSKEDDCERDCEGGDCDALSGPSLGSVRFRLALGRPDRDHVSGFLYFNRDAVFTPSADDLVLLARSDADITDTALPGRRTVACSDPHGYTCTVTNISNGISLSLDFTATGVHDRTWEIVRDGETMRFRKYSAGGELMRTYAYAQEEAGSWVERETASGLATVRRTEGSLLEGELWDETIRTCGAVTGSHVRVRSEIVGWGDWAVRRECERWTKTAEGGWLKSYADYWNDWTGSRRHGALRCEWGDDRPWSYHVYDAEGRETLRLEQMNGSSVGAAGEFLRMLPDDLTPENVPATTDCRVTAYDYTPLPGDSNVTNDVDRVRTETTYVVQDGERILVGRTWTRYVRDDTQGWPRVTETMVRACSQTAADDDPGNAVLTRTYYSSDAAQIPYVLRGATLSETDEDGVTTTHAITLTDSIMRTVARRTKDGHEAPTRAVTERDRTYGNLLYEATQLTADPSVEFGWQRHVYDTKNRLRSTQYDDGTSETNAYSCCRLLFRTDRTGATTHCCATAGSEHLYGAEEEVSLADYERGDRRPPNWGTGTRFTAAFRVTQRHSDAFGRETNVTVRAGSVRGASASPDSTFPYGDRRETDTLYPYGTSDCRVTVDPRGLLTVGQMFSRPSAESEAVAEYGVDRERPEVYAESTSYRGGGTYTYRIADGKEVLSSHDASYRPDGTRVESRVTESDDCGLVIASVVRYDFLGRPVSSWTPTSSVSNVYDGASWRLLATHDAVSGLSVTNRFNALGREIGSESCGVVTLGEESYESLSNAWWKVFAKTVFSGALTNSCAVTRERLTGLSDGLRSESLAYEWGVPMRHARTACDAVTNVTETVWTAAEGESVRTLRYGRPVEERTLAGRAVTYYDPFGRVHEVCRSGPQGGDVLDRWLWRVYDEVGDPWVDREYTLKTGSSAATHWKDAYTFTDCRGRAAVTIDASGARTDRTFDTQGRTLSESGATYPVRLGYDSAGRRTSLGTTRDGAEYDETRWTFDPQAGLCLAKTYADGTAVAHTYTSDGLPLRTTQPDGSWTENVYDAQRRRVGLASSDPSCAYGLGLDVFGRTVAASNAVASACRVLNRFGTATNEALTVGARTATLERGTDACGRVVSLRVAGGVRTSYVYADDGCLASVSNADCTVVYRYGNDRSDLGYELMLPDGRVFSRTLTRDRYQREEVTSVTNRVDGCGSGYAYAYDLCGRPVSRNGDAFGYNARGEVTAATVAGRLDTYDYDFIGNETWQAADAVNRIASRAYSAKGELLDYGCGCTYDARARLRTVSHDDYGPESYWTCTVTNLYDWAGRRVVKSSSHGTHTFFYDGWMPVREEIARPDGSASRVEYVWGKDLSGAVGGSGGVGGLLYVKVDGALYVPFYDANGNVTGYWNAAGETVAEYVYDAFGALVAASGSSADLFAIRYATKYCDVESDLCYFGYRFYAPSLRRWLTRDPIGEKGGANLYSSCENNMVCYCDKLGLARFISRALWAPDPSVWGRGGEFEARHVLRYLLRLGILWKQDADSYDNRWEIKDLAMTPLSEIRKDVDRYSDDVYFIAHGDLRVTRNGRSFTMSDKGAYNRRRGDVVDDVFVVDGHGRCVYLNDLGPKLSRDNTFGCYISKDVREESDGVLQNARVDDYGEIYTRLLRRLSRYENMHRKCKIHIVIYEGEVGGVPVSTERAMWLWPPKSEKYYEDAVRKFNTSYVINGVNEE